jgi:glycosyltransferase involved in cell wall biosynthesis
MFTTKYFSASEFVSRVLKRKLGAESTVVYSGIEITPNSFVSEPSSRSFFTLGIIGSTEKNKGQLIAVKAMKILNEKWNGKFRLKIIGKTRGTDYFSDIQQFIKNNNMASYIDYCGEIEDQEKIYQDLDIVLLCSYEEAFGRVIIEAMKYGKLIISTNTGGIPEIIDHEIDGILFEKGDFKGLADILDRIFEKPKLREQLIKNAFEKVKKFSLTKTNDQITKEIALLLD